MRRKYLLLATTLALLTGPSFAQTGKSVVTLDTSKPMVSTSTQEQHFSDTVDIKPGQETLPLTFNFSNGDASRPGFKWLRISIAGRPFLTEKNFKGQGLSMSANGWLSSGANQIYVVAGGEPGATLSWTLTTPPVTISSVAPADAVVGKSLTIRGSNFSPNASEDAVTFKDGQTATPQQASSSSLQVAVPNEVKAGNNQITVTARGLKSAPFKLKVKGGPPPVLSGIEGGYGGPLEQGFAGMTVTINGTNFGDSSDKVTVMFGDTEVPATSHTKTQITVNLPNSDYGAALPITVKVNDVKSQNSLSINMLHQNRVW